MAYKLYQVAILEHPKKVKKDEPCEAPKILLEPVCVLAQTDQSAAIQTAMKNANRFTDVDPARIELVVRPF